MAPEALGFDDDDDVNETSAAGAKRQAPQHTSEVEKNV